MQFNKYIQTHTHTTRIPVERTTRLDTQYYYIRLRSMAAPDCGVVCNSTHTHTEKSGKCMLPRCSLWEIKTDKGAPPDHLEIGFADEEGPVPTQTNEKEALHDFKRVRCMRLCSYVRQRVWRREKLQQHFFFIREQHFR